MDPDKSARSNCKVRAGFPDVDPEETAVLEDFAMRSQDMQVFLLPWQFSDVPYTMVFDCRCRWFLSGNLFSKWLGWSVKRYKRTCFATNKGFSHSNRPCTVKMVKNEPLVFFSH